LKSAFRSLFCATHSDWERFDEIFDAYWLGAGMRQVRTLAGVAGESRIPVRRRADRTLSPGLLGQPDHVERRNDGDGESAADGQARREGASRSENLWSTDFRHITSPDDMAQAGARRAACPRHGGGLVRRDQIRRRGRRLDLRRTIHRNVSHGGTPVLAWRRRKIAAAARRFARRLGSMNLTPRSSFASCMAWWTPSAKRRHSCSIPGLRMCRRRCAIATPRARWTSFR
jgi:uncharacterized protein with von Willebrand factor type A (vWA) domain